MSALLTDEIVSGQSATGPDFSTSSAASSAETPIEWANHFAEAFWCRTEPQELGENKIGNAGAN